MPSREGSRPTGVDPPFDVVALVASAGGLQALSQVLGGLPADFSLPLLVAQHRPVEHSHLLVELLAQRTPLKVTDAEEGEVPRPGTAYVAPGGRHLEVTPYGALSVARAGRVRFVCPSADLLFQSLARRTTARAVAVVLTGTGTDGAQGVKALHEAGGFVIAQDPATAASPGMPSAAIATGAVDLLLPLEQIASALLTRIWARGRSGGA